MVTLTFSDFLPVQCTVPQWSISSWFIFYVTRKAQPMFRKVIFRLLLSTLMLYGLYFRLNTYIDENITLHAITTKHILSLSFSHDNTASLMTVIIISRIFNSQEQVLREEKIKPDFFFFLPAYDCTIKFYNIWVQLMIQLMHSEGLLNFFLWWQWRVYWGKTNYVIFLGRNRLDNFLKIKIQILLKN